jgi:hypothetical protein
MKHGEFYCCKRLRLLEYLMKRGFEPIKDIPDPYNWKYRQWIFKNNEQLEEALEEYFNQHKKDA